MMLRIPDFGEWLKNEITLLMLCLVTNNTNKQRAYEIGTCDLRLSQCLSGLKAQIHNCSAQNDKKHGLHHLIGFGRKQWQRQRQQLLQFVCHHDLPVFSYGGS
jgi:hypothetical protein